MTASDTSASPPPHVLREYALLADGERGAIIGPDGGIVWLCAPRWHDDAVFASLIGGGTSYQVAPVEPRVWGGYYEPGSLIWHSRWTTHTGFVECHEALAYPADDRRLILLRRLTAIDTATVVHVQLHAGTDYGRKPVTSWRRRAGTWVARRGKLHLRWLGAECARDHNGVLEFDLPVAVGEHHDLILEISLDESDAPLTADLLWEQTRASWRRAVPDLDQVLDPAGSRQSVAVLRGLTSRSGGMVAAATTSLPERAEAGRNYDYRYVWIRDQCYTGQAAAAAGVTSLLDDAVHFVAARLNEHGPQLAPAYTIDGGAIPDQKHLRLPGYPGGYDIIGNHVNDQFQLDAFGEALLLLAAAAAHDRLNTDHWSAAEAAAAAIAHRWHEPDAGIWEIDNRPWTHSRLIGVAGLRAMAAHAPTAVATDWLTLADRILAHTAQTATHPRGYWKRSPDDAGLDAAVLLPGLRGAVAPSDPRTEATLQAYLQELTFDGYAYRFRHDARALPEAEGSFLLCGYLVALSLQQQRQPVEARAWYERTSAARGPAGLFSEEYDARQHQMRGNLPQAFVHALALETAATLN